MISEFAVLAICTGRHPSATTSLLASHLGTTHHTVGTDTLVTAIGCREALAIFVFFAVVFANRATLGIAQATDARLAFGAIRIALASCQATLAFRDNRDARCCCITSVAVRLTITTTYGIPMIRTSARHHFADTHLIARPAMAAIVTILIFWTLNPSNPPAVGLAGAICTSNVTLETDAAITAIGIREFFAIFVLLAVVLTACA
jgi:hypothetical protein